MALAESIFAKLSNAAAATAALVGIGAVCRLYPTLAPSKVLHPYIAWQEVSAVPVVTHDGRSTFGTRLVQFSAVAETYLAARDLGAAIIHDLDSVTLAAGELCTHCTEMDGYSEDTNQYIRIIEATFMAAPAVPA